MSSAFFTPLRKVADLLPGVVSKTVVYGGAARQTRSDCAAVPLTDLSSVIDRLDVDREIADFISERTGAAPRRSDIEILDDVFYTRIRPTLDALEPYVARIGDSLFQDHGWQGQVNRGDSRVTGSDVLLSARWEQTKESCLRSPGFGLSDDRQLVVGSRFTLSSYTGRGRSDFTIKIAVRWTFGATHVTRSASIDSEEISRLATTITYSDLEQTPLDLDRVVAEIMKSLLDRTAELSAA